MPEQCSGNDQVDYDDPEVSLLGYFDTEKAHWQNAVKHKYNMA